MSRSREYWLDKPDEFWIRSYYEFRQTEGKPVQLSNWGECDLFITKLNERWGVFCAVTGALLVPRRYTPMGWADPSAFALSESEAIDRAEERLREMSSDGLITPFHRVLVENFGLSPRYRWEDMPDED